MKATGFTGVSPVFGRERKIRFDGGVLQIDDLTLGEAQILVGLLEKVPAALSATQPAPALARAPAPARQPAAPQGEPPPPATSPAVTPPTEPETKLLSPAEKRKATLAAKKAAKEQAAADAKAAEDEEPPHDPETGEVIDEDAAEREAIQEQEAEEEARIAAEAKAKGSNGETDDATAAASEDVPAEIKKARHLRSVIAHLVEDRNITEVADIVAWCKANVEQIPVVKRVGDKLADRVGRALQIMSS